MKAQMEKDVDNVVEFKPQIITGGKGVEGSSWLKNLKVGTTFLFRNKIRQGQGDVGVQRAMVIKHFQSTTMLFDNLNQEIYFIVDTDPFSNVMRLVEVLDVPAEE